MSDSAPGVGAFRLAQLDAGAALAALPGLIELLQDAADSGASVGFLPPLAEEAAARFWHEVIAAVQAQTTLLWAAYSALDGRPVGSVQLALAGRPNAAHRAEVQKLLVHRAARRQGLGTALMRTAEQAALALGRTLLVLDTVQGDGAEQLYQGLGYQRAGAIPAYARGADGRLHATGSTTACWRPTRLADSRNTRGPGAY